MHEPVEETDDRDLSLRQLGERAGEYDTAIYNQNYNKKDGSYEA